MDAFQSLIELPWFVQLPIALGFVVFVLYFRRDLRAMVNVRMEAETFGSPDLLRISLEAENFTASVGKHIVAWIVIEEHDELTKGELRNDYVDDYENVAESLKGTKPDDVFDGTDKGKRLAQVIRVLQTKKIEPKELLQAQILYRWSDRPLIRCCFSFRFYYWRGICRDRRSVVKWFANPNTATPPPAVA